MPIIHNFPSAKAEMLIRRPIQDVFQAFVDPEVTVKFWFTHSSGKLEKNSHIRWEWAMYGVSDVVYVKELCPKEYLLLQSSDGSLMEWRFAQRSESETFVSIIHSGFAGTNDELVGQAIDSTGGFTMVLCGLKAFLEHGVQLNLIADKAPIASE